MNRRGLLVGLAAAVAAPAVIRIPGLLMPVKSMVIPAPTMPEVLAKMASFMEEAMKAIELDIRMDLMVFGSAFVRADESGIMHSVSPLDVWGGRYSAAELSRMEMITAPQPSLDPRTMPVLL